MCHFLGEYTAVWENVGKNHLHGKGLGSLMQMLS